ncbi:MAG: DUF4105 domain-containing protein [Bacteroidia bacterium]|nr:DUF4105 domain-containing protein [Bacteroidia bacterium]
MKNVCRNIVLYLLFITLSTTTLSAKESVEDSIQISLLTCDPGEDIYTLFGHTAIRYENFTQDLDIVFNYGLFSFKTPNFIWRFALGETDYQLGAYDFSRFAAEYEDEGRRVCQQTLSLTKKEKENLIRLLEKNYLPENRLYRYNFFYDNCATRPRDKIEESIEGTIHYPIWPKDYSISFRDVIHECTSNQAWARFGIDFCLGSEADRLITRRELMFAPIYLMGFYKKALVFEQGNYRPLVCQNKEIIEGNQVDEVTRSNFPSPLQSALLLFMGVCGLTIYGLKKNKSWWGIDLFLFSLVGLAGCVLAFLAMCSQHPAVNHNYLLLVFHPFQLLATPYLIYCAIKRKKCPYHLINAVVLTLFIATFAFIPQKIDLTILPLALCLLIRSTSYLISTYKKKK